jgi:hypothetical protein
MKPWQTSLNKAPRKGRKKKKELIWREEELLMWSPSDKDALGFAVPSFPTLLAYLTNKRAFQHQLKNWYFGLLALPTLQQKVSLYPKWFHWILSEFISSSELRWMKKQKNSLI